MATPTELQAWKDELAAVRQALVTIAAGGQSVSIGDLSYTEVNYSALAARECALERKIGRADGTRPAVLRVNLSGVVR